MRIIGIIFLERSYLYMKQTLIIYFGAALGGVGLIRYSNLIMNQSIISNGFAYLSFLEATEIQSNLNCFKCLI